VSLAGGDADTGPLGLVANDGVDPPLTVVQAERGADADALSDGVALSRPDADSLAHALAASLCEFADDGVADTVPETDARIVAESVSRDGKELSEAVGESVHVALAVPVSDAVTEREGGMEAERREVTLATKLAAPLVLAAALCETLLLAVVLMLAAALGDALPLATLLEHAVALGTLLRLGALALAVALSTADADGSALSEAVEDGSREDIAEWLSLADLELLCDGAPLRVALAD
jgi:hypothetical protein